MIQNFMFSSESKNRQKLIYTAKTLKLKYYLFLQMTPLNLDLYLKDPVLKSRSFEEKLKIVLKKIEIDQLLTDGKNYELKNGLVPLWPYFLRKMDHTSFKSNFKVLKQRLGIEKSDLCFFFYHFEKNPEQYPENNMSFLLEHYQISASNFDAKKIMDMILSRECAESFYALITFSKDKETLRQNKNKQRMQLIVRRLLVKKKEILSIFKRHPSPSDWLNILDDYLSPADASLIKMNERTLNTLKFMLLFQCFNFYFLGEVSPCKEEANTIINVLVQGLFRILYELYSTNHIQVFLLMQWISQGMREKDSFWRKSEQLKSQILIHLMSLSTILSDSKNYSGFFHQEHEDLSIVYILELQNMCQQQTKKIANIYIKSRTMSMEIETQSNLMKHEMVEYDTISVGKNLKSRSNENKQLRGILGEIGRRAESMELNRVLILVQRYLQEIKMEVLEGQIFLGKQIVNAYLDIIRSVQRFKHIYPSTSIVPKLQQQIAEILHTLDITDIMTNQNIRKEKHSKPFNFEEYTDLGWSDFIDANQTTISVDGLSHQILNIPSLRYPLLVIYQLQILQNKYDRGIILSNKNDSQQNQPPNLIKLRDRHSGKEETQCFSQELLLSKIDLMIKKISNKEEVCYYLKRIMLINHEKITGLLFLNLVKYFLAKEYIHTIASKKILQQIFKDLIQHYVLNSQHAKTSWIKTLLLTAHNYFEMWKIPKIQNSKKKQKKSPNSFTTSQQYICLLINLFPIKRDYLKIYAQAYQKLNCVKQALYMLNHYHRRKIKTVKLKPTEEEVWQYYRLLMRIQSNVGRCEEVVKKMLKGDNQQQMYKQLFNIEFSQREEKIKSFIGINKKIVATEMTEKNEPLSSWDEILNLFCFKNSWKEIRLGIINSINSTLTKLAEKEEIDRLFNELLFLEKISFQLQISSVDWPFIINALDSLDSYQTSVKILNFLSNFELEIKQKNRLEQLKWNQMIRHDKDQEIIQLIRHKQIWEMSFDELRAGMLTYFRLEQYKMVMMYFKQCKNTDHFSLNAEHINNISQLQMYYIKAVMATSITFSFNKFSPAFKDLLQSLKKSFNNCKQFKEELTQPFFQLYRITCENYTNLKPQEQKIIFKYLNDYYELLAETQIIYRKEVGQRQQLQKLKKLLIEALYFILRYIFNESNYCQNLIESFNISKFRPQIILPHKDYLILSITTNLSKNKLIRQLLIKIAQSYPVFSAWWISSLSIHCSNSGLKKKLITEEDKEIQELGESIKQNIQMKNLISEKCFEWMSILNQIVFMKPSDQKMKQIYEKLISKLKKMQIPEQLVSPFDLQVKLLKLNQILLLNDGKSRPKSVSFRAQKNGQICEIIFIVKKVEIEDYRIQSCVANFFKKSNIVSQDVTYSIIHLSKNALLIEHVPHFDSLRSVMIADKDQYHTSIIRQCFEKGAKKLNEKYNELVDSNDFFLHSFLERRSQASIRQWYQRFKNFVSTFAQWSYLIYVVDLGDRHDKNILVSQNGKTIHIDFEYIFSFGLQLNYPEWVPFRMTHNISGELSIIEPYALFYSQFVKAAYKYKHIQRDFWSSLSFFSYSKHKLLDEKICKRAQLKDKILSQSLRLIRQAHNHDLLKDMYVGWCSYV